MASGGAIAGPAGDGRLAMVAHDDVADVAVEVLLGAGHDGRAYDVTGGDLRTLGELAAELSEVVGRDIPMWTRRSSRRGSRVGPTVRRTGHPPLGLRELLGRDPSVLDPLRAA